MPLCHVPLISNSCSFPLVKHVKHIKRYLDESTKMQLPGVSNVRGNLYIFKVSGIFLSKRNVNAPVNSA